MTIWHEYRQATGKHRAELEEQIIRDNWKLSHYVANRIRFTHHYDYDDIHAIALVGLLEAVRSYDPDAGSKFAPYARTKMRWEIMQELDKFRYKKREGEKELLSIYLKLKGQEVRIIDRVEDDSPNRHKRTEDGMTIRSILQTVNASSEFTRREKEVFFMVIGQQDKTMRQIATDEGVSPQMIQGYMRKAVNKVRASMPEILEEGLL